MKVFTKKKVTLITYDRPSLDYYINELNAFFENELYIEGFCILEGLNSKLECDIILTLSPIVTEIIKKFDNLEAEIIQGNRTILIEGYNKLKNLPDGIKAMLVSTNKIFSLDLASFLYKIGLKKIDFVPVYPELEEIPSLDIAITAGQLKYVPPKATKIIDIGWRRISTSTFMSLITTMNIKRDDLVDKLKKYSTTVVNLDFMNTPLDRISKLESLLNIVIDQIDYGIIIINKNNKIIYINRSFANIINEDAKSTEMLYLNKNIIPPELYAEINKNKIIDNSIIFLKKTNKEVVVSKGTIAMYGETLAYAITIKDVTQVQDLERRLRGQLKKKGYVAKYTLNNIIGNSTAIKECIYQAERISCNPRSVLIVGESGTGKEIFAQAIHNYSDRKDKPFVAINCATIPLDLLESELFGYEEGSFTGANKGGKRGLFEMAHTGTLFLDEIGDIDLSLQAKLLRVIEEKEVMRIGGTGIIPINVRIIAATNKDLEKYVDEEKFRMDLYYRLNVFSLFIPPLRERSDDIPLIIESIMKESGFNSKIFDSQLIDALCKYSWKGNVRELKNCVEYMAYMGGNILTIQDLPPNIYKNIFHENPSKNNIFSELSRNDMKLVVEIMKLIKFKPMGRRSIHSACLSKGYPVSENKIRNILNTINKKGFLNYGKGCSGSSLTKAGEAFLNKLK